VALTGLTDRQLEFSPYLRDIAHRYPNCGDFDEIIAKVAGASAHDLLELKSQLSLRLTQTNFDSFDEIGDVWSNFADLTIDRALTLAWAQTAKRYRLKLPSGSVPGLYILGLGKLGGMDLNFSSDVDLIAFFDADALPVPEHMGQAFIASDVCKRLTQILQPRNEPQFVWRVDWRLRPESSGTGLAMSAAKAETFYFFRSLPWHRLALMKARCVAGDRNSAAAFLSRLEPYIWRRNLDFTTLDELASLKTRINNEHPGLQNERAAPEPITPEAKGFNLKLGRGGIREIEFIANAQQLIHGGKRPSLRVTHTRTALSQLAGAKLLSEADCESLREDYSLFRRVENAVQMVSNEQTHIVPSGNTFLALQALLGYPANFDEDIYRRRKRVHKTFSALFADNPAGQTPPNLSSLEGPAEKIALSWSHGFRDHGLSQSTSNKFIDLGHRLTARVLSQPREDQAFERVDSFLKQIGRSEQYFALLNRHPDLLDRLISPLLHSPNMSHILKQSPHIIDIFITAHPSSLAEQSRFVMTSPDYETRLEALRRFVNEHLFHSYSHFLEGALTAEDTQRQLTALA
jgi:glutamate-ammonia-ligase adenylyltransferase